MSIHKSIILCADDYGISSGVSKGIRELIEAKRISATSVMVISDNFLTEANHLKPLMDKIDVGLHITLTDQTPLSAEFPKLNDSRFPSFLKLLRLAYFNKLPLSLIEKEIEMQFSLFADTFKQIPSFLDGHQHVHVLPGISEIVLRLFKKYMQKNNRTYIRSCYNSFPVILRREIALFKSSVLSILSRNFHNQLIKNKISKNDGLIGLYNWKDDVDYSSLFQKFASYATTNSLIMCHPGYVDEGLINKDSMTYSRENELNFFKSALYLEILEKYHLKISRFAN